MNDEVKDAHHEIPRRGDIYYITGENAIGSEYTAERRPAIVVSNDKCNRFSNTVEVVYLTTKRKKPLPTHVAVFSAPRFSTALCEQITSVAKERLENRVGHASESEMNLISVACAISIDIIKIDYYPTKGGKK